MRASCASMLANAEAHLREGAAGARSGRTRKRRADVNVVWAGPTACYEAARETRGATERRTPRAGTRERIGRAPASMGRLVTRGGASE